MGKEEIIKALNDKNRNDGKLAYFCKTPRTPTDLKNCKTKNELLTVVFLSKNLNAITFTTANTLQHRWISKLWRPYLDKADHFIF